MRLAKPRRLVTERLVLRALRPSDAPELACLLNDRSITATTLAIPFPYTLKDAAEWIGRQDTDRKQGRMLNFAITLRADGRLVGGVGLSSISPEHSRAELGYWVAKEFWARGHCTEACCALLDYAFRVLRLQRVYASHFPNNPASGRVMQKLGMKREGYLRRHVRRRGRYVDLVCYGVLASDLRVRRGRPMAGRASPAARVDLGRGFR